MKPTRKSLLGLVLLVALGAGCEKTSPNESATSTTPPTRSYRLDDTVRFIYRDADRGRRQAERLEDIPLEHRAAVILHRPGEPVVDDLVYVANLLDAGAGDTVPAHKMTQRDHFHRAQAAQLGGWHGRLVVLAAQEKAQLDRRSERSEASREAKELLEQVVPRETHPKVAP